MTSYLNDISIEPEKLGSILALGRNSEIKCFNSLKSNPVRSDYTISSIDGFKKAVRISREYFYCGLGGKFII